MSDKIKIAMVSLGCPKNQVDAELILAGVKKFGFEITVDLNEADVAIINTCGFIADAKKESIENILEVSELKKDGNLKLLVVTGCLAERYRDEISAEMPEVDMVVGLGKNADLPQLISDALKSGAHNDYADKCLLPIDGERLLSTPGYYAYLKIAEGCNNKCTYCAIPNIRGRYRSREMENIVSEAKELAQKGVKELVVIAQDTTYYGYDLYGKFMLPELLRELNKIEGIKWIRLLYAYPDFISDELIDAIAELPKVVPYIDIPMQHADESVLRAMYRHGDRKFLEDLIAKLRAKIPSIVIRTTLMVGFPGEDDRAFGELSEFVKSQRFERMGCFSFSPEEGTKAAELPNQVDEETKQKRNDVLMDIQYDISSEIASNQIGKCFETVVEGYDGYIKKYYGRSMYEAPDIDGKVFFTSDTKLAEGDFVQVKITDYMDYDLIGETV